MWQCNVRELDRVLRYDNVHYVQYQSKKNVCHDIPQNNFISFLDVDECASVPCKNNGTCTDYIDIYTCKCIPGFQGDNCETGKCLVFDRSSLLLDIKIIIVSLTNLTRLWCKIQNEWLHNENGQYEKVIVRFIYLSLNKEIVIPGFCSFLYHRLYFYWTWQSD